LMRRLYRSSKEKVLCGVCGGLAEYLNIDPVIIRLAAAALLILNPTVIIVLYIAACVLMPEAPAGAMQPPSTSRGVEIQGRDVVRIVMLVVGAVLLAIGASLLSTSVLGWGVVDLLKTFWVGLVGAAKLVVALVLIAIGLAIVLATVRKL